MNIRVLIATIDSSLIGSYLPSLAEIRDIYHMFTLLGLDDLKELSLFTFIVARPISSRDNAALLLSIS